MTQTAQSPDLIYIARKDVRVDPTFNPRKRFNPSDIEQFAERLQRSGWLSPLLVRADPAGQGFLLVAGERRLRAVTHLGWDEIPVTVLEIDDQEHRKLALVENVDRRQLSVIEEAQAAREHVDAYGGDHKAAARSLGWKESKLEHRLQLLHATPDVQKALLEKKIQLGHAELFAALPAQNQDKALPRVIADSITVTALRDQLTGFAQPLAKAIFALDGCAQCPFNSACQGTLFSTHIDAGLCTNKTCYRDKEREAIAARTTELAEDFGTVALVSEKVPGTTIPLVKFGESGVGAAQFDACRSCQFRGALIHDAPGPSIGKVEEPICFNRSCHKEKADAYVVTLPAATATEQATPGTAAANNASAAPRGAKSSQGMNTPSSKKAKAKTAVRATPTAVRNQYAAIVRRSMEVSIQQDEKIGLALSVVAMLRLAAQEAPGLTIDKACELHGIKFASGGYDHQGLRKPESELFSRLHAMDQPKLQALLTALAMTTFTHEPDGTAHSGKINRRGVAAQMAVASQTDLAPYVQVDTQFLASHTKTALELVLEESGFKAWMQSQPDGDKTYTNLLSQKKADIVSGVLEAGFDFAGYIPSGAKTELEGWANYKAS